MKNLIQTKSELWTRNLEHGKDVYGERIKNFKQGEFREWNPFRSKLAAALMKGIENPLNENSRVLYLGAATGTTVSHFSDLLTEGYVVALEFSPEVFADLYHVADNRKNIIPLLGDALQPQEYAFRVPPVDIVYQDIAQRMQTAIFKENCQMFLKKGSIAILCVKSRSIDVTKDPNTVFKEVQDELSKWCNILMRKNLSPYQKDHCIFIVKV